MFLLCIDCGRPEYMCNCFFKSPERYSVVSDGDEYTVFDIEKGIDLFPTVADSRGAKHGRNQGQKCNKNVANKIARALNLLEEVSK